MDVFFALMIVNIYKCYSSSFSDVLDVCVASATSPQIKEAPGEQEIFSRCLHFRQIEKKFCTECLCSSVYQDFSVFYLLCHCMEIGIFFSSVCGKKNYYIDF